MMSKIIRNPAGLCRSHLVKKSFSSLNTNVRLPFRAFELEQQNNNLLVKNSSSRVEVRYSITQNAYKASQSYIHPYGKSSYILSNPGRSYYKPNMKFYRIELNCASAKNQFLIRILSYLDLHLARTVEITQRFYSDGRRPGFFSNIVENIKSEYSKSKEMQDSLKKFREEAQKLEESEALKEARRKFESIEGESTKGSNVIKEQISGIADKVKGVKDKLDDVEALKKATEIGNDR